MRPCLLCGGRTTYDSGFSQECVTTGCPNYPSSSEGVIVGEVDLGEGIVLPMYSKKWLGENGHHWTTDWDLPFNNDMHPSHTAPSWGQKNREFLQRESIKGTTKLGEPSLACNTFSVWTNDDGHVVRWRQEVLES